MLTREKKVLEDKIEVEIGPLYFIRRTWNESGGGCFQFTYFNAKSFDHERDSLLSTLRNDGDQPAVDIPNKKEWMDFLERFGESSPKSAREAQKYVLSWMKETNSNPTDPVLHHALLRLYSRFEEGGNIPDILLNNHLRVLWEESTHNVPMAFLTVTNPGHTQNSKASLPWFDVYHLPDLTKKTRLKQRLEKNGGSVAYYYMLKLFQYREIDESSRDGLHEFADRCHLWIPVFGHSKTVGRGFEDRIGGTFMGWALKDFYGRGWKRKIERWASDPEACEAIRGYVADVVNASRALSREVRAANAQELLDEDMHPDQGAEQGVELLFLQKRSHHVGNWSAPTTDYNLKSGLLYDFDDNTRIFAVDLSEDVFDHTTTLPRPILKLKAGDDFIPPDLKADSTYYALLGSFFRSLYQRLGERRREADLATESVKRRTAEERAALFETIRGSTEQLVELLQEANEPLQHLAGALDPVGALVFGGLAADRFYPEGGKVISLNKQVPALHVTHTWNAPIGSDEEKGAKLKQYLDQTAAVLLTLFGETSRVRVPVWDYFRLYLQLPSPESKHMVNALTQHLDGINDPKKNDARYLEYESVYFGDEAKVRILFETVKLWFHEIYKFQTFPEPDADLTKMEGLPVALLQAAFRVWGGGEEIMKVPEGMPSRTRLRVSSRRCIDTVDALAALNGIVGGFKDAELTLPTSGSNEATLTLTPKARYSLKDPKSVADSCRRAQQAEHEGRRVRRGDMTYVMVQLFGDIQPDEPNGGSCIQGKGTINQPNVKVDFPSLPQEITTGDGTDSSIAPPSPISITWTYNP